MCLERYISSLLMCGKLVPVRLDTASLSVFRSCLFRKEADGGPFTVHIQVKIIPLICASLALCQISLMETWVITADRTQALR